MEGIASKIKAEFVMEKTVLKNWKTISPKLKGPVFSETIDAVSYTHLRAHETLR